MLSSSPGETDVADYRIYSFADGHIAGAQSVEAEDDAAAFVHASTLTGGGAFEVWQGARMVVSFDSPMPDVTDMPDAAAG